MTKRKYTSIDLFSGAGGLSLGFTDTNRFKSILAVEFDKSAAATYARNFNHELFDPKGNSHINIKKKGIVVNGDIRDLKNIEFESDIIIGGPPCQGFSPLGKISPKDEHLKMNQLWQEYMRLVSQVKPLVFVIENVPELLRSKEFLAIELIAKRLGYNLTSGELKAVEFGVPQKRVRAFIMGILGAEPKLPVSKNIRTSIRDAIGDLPLYPQTTKLSDPPEVGSDEIQNLHFGRNPTDVSLKRYKLIPPGGNRFDLMREAPELTPRCWLEKPSGSTDVFGRLEWDKPSYTIRTEFFKPEKGCYLHPEADRPITHREAARLQTFPDNFTFIGSKTEIAKQIGNAVPPLLARELAIAISHSLDKLPVAELRKNRNPLSSETFNLLLSDVIKEIYENNQNTNQLELEMKVIL
ncbi:DNA cytosine methyltransferase [Bacillus sp. FJAT-27445]|uniref:DNA cytosine methyltransferase n=1 Tax=Bacillus sp. FJAT-27445 TaxID=1679166 RepID=UPI0009EA853B|nr:DNA cytosine methyltransferase [Bacillus sp. FJAT-27445]